MAVSPAEDVIRFGVFELDLKAGQLTRYGTKLRLPQQPLQLLAVLLERPGETFGPNARAKTTSQRNLYRVSLP